MRMAKRSPFKPKVKGSYRVESKADEATVYIYDEIGWFGISAEKFIQDLNDLKAKTVHIRFNSPGGSVFDGTAVFNAIKQHSAKTISHIDGLAASISSVIALAADEVRMAENAFLMIHDPWSIMIGNAEAMREEADLLDKVGGVIAKTYIDKTGKEEAEILEMMGAETWMTAHEALENGFIDTIEGVKEEEAKATLFDLSVFANVPEALKESKTPLNERDLERILRDAGCSIKQAKAILSEGFAGAFRDGEQPSEQKEEVKDDLRDAEPQPEPKKKDRIHDLLIRAEQMAPSTVNN